MFGRSSKAPYNICDHDRILIYSTDELEKEENRKDMGITGLEFQCCPVPPQDPPLKKLVTGFTCEPAFWKRVGIYVDEENTISHSAFFQPGSVYLVKNQPKWMQDMIQFGAVNLTTKYVKEMLDNVKSSILSGNVGGIDDLENIKGSRTWEFRTSRGSIEQKFKITEDVKNMEVKQLFVKCDPFEIGAHYYQYIVTYKDGNIKADVSTFANTKYVVDNFFKDDLNKGQRR